MSKEAQATMQQLRNRVETQSHGWTAFKAATALGYTSAYNLHKDALEHVKKNIELDNERCWLVFTLLFSAVSVPIGIAAKPLTAWMGRLIEEGEEAGELAKEMFNKTVEIMSDKAKEKIKGSSMEQMAGEGDESRPWEPVVDSPYTYEKKMELMLEKLAVEIMRPLDELVARSASWELSDALAWSLEFESSCPYMTDLPRDLDRPFITKVQTITEWTMWVEWALRRDRPWWDNGRLSQAMLEWDPVLDRLQQVGVPVNEVTSVVRVGDGFGNRAESVLDMVKFIDWATRNEPHRQTTWTQAQLTRARQLLFPQMEVKDQLRCCRQN